MKKESSEPRKIYRASDIQEKLDLGKTKTYELLEEVYQNQSPFVVFKFGRTYRIPKESFDNWYNQQLT